MAHLGYDMGLEPRAVAYYAGLLFLAYFILKRVVRGLTNPRRHIPGPWYGKYTSLVYEYQRIRGRHSHYAHRQHAKYGPVILVSPNRTHIADGEAWAQISRPGSGFVKSPFYERFRIGPEHVLFSMTNPKHHAARRKLFARSFTIESLRNKWEPGIRELAEMTVQQIKRDAGTGVADVYKWWRLMTADVIALLSFGETFDMVKEGKKSHYFNALVNVGFLITINDLLWPFRATWLKNIFPSVGAREFLKANDIIYDQGTLAVQNLRQARSDRPNMFTHVLEEAEVDEKGQLTDDGIRSEAAVFMMAGSDTTAFSLTYLVWCVLRRPELQREIELEVASLPEGFTDKDVEALPVLNRALDETMRLYNAASGFMGRVVPKGGATLGGYLFPEGSIVGSSNFSLARQAHLFENPDSFDVTRWENMTPQQKRSAQPFSLGSRNCIGQYLARIESRLAAALFFRELKGAKVSKDMTDSMMEFKVKFLAAPNGEKCEITLLEGEAQ